MTICPKCERPIRTGRVRAQFICDFEEDASGVAHRVRPFQEEWVEHEVCEAAPQGD